MFNIVMRVIIVKSDKADIKRSMYRKKNTSFDKAYKAYK